MENKIIKGNTIYVVSDRMSRVYKWDDKSDKLDKGVEVISINDIKPVLNNNKISVLNTPHYQEDDIYIRHPYLENTFIKATHDPVDLFCDKFYAVSDVLQYLGVTKVSASIVMASSQKREIDNRTNVGFKFVKANLNINSINEQYYKKSADLLRVYDNPQISYEMALSKAQKNGLLSDSKLYSIIEQRGHNMGGSTLKRDFIQVNITDKMNESLNVAFSLKFMFFKISNSYSQALETCNDIDFKINIEF